MTRSLRPLLGVGASCDKRVRMEIQIFLRALESYASGFARDPEVTFDEHQARLMRLAGSRPKRQRKSSARRDR